ncbi:Dabb family protein [Paenibacillus sp. sgz500958]|uniref:Dabb family protein n=1 Tax=Paenibacillus sp. sgz500958 TaxID=3242475 RepID=UPI0036D2C75A
MIANNVLLKLKNPEKDTSEVQAALLSMKGKIDILLDIQIEKNVRPEEGAYDVLFITKFASMEDLDAYLAHPAHLEVSKFIFSVLDTMASLCYEVSTSRTD